MNDCTVSFLLKGFPSSGLRIGPKSAPKNVQQDGKPVNRPKMRHLRERIKSGDCDARAREHLCIWRKDPSKVEVYLPTNLQLSQV